MSDDKQYQPKSVLFRNADFTQYMSAGMGIIDFGSYFDNEMSKNKFIIKFVEQTRIAYEDNVIKTPKNFKFPYKLTSNLDKIWNGNTYYATFKDIKTIHKIFCYDNPLYVPSENIRIRKKIINIVKERTLNQIMLKIMYNPSSVGISLFDMTSDEVEKKALQIVNSTTDMNSFESQVNEIFNDMELVPLPKFRNMIPNQKVADDTMLIQIREPMPLKYAFERANYQSLIQEANLQFMDGRPKFTYDEMDSMTVKSYHISRSVFNSLMEDFEFFFNQNWNYISVEFQKIIDNSGQGLELPEDYEESSFVANLL